MYNFTEIEKKWQKYWEENETFKMYGILANQNTMHLICFHTHQVKDYM